ncbi:MAG: LysR substrate-binding domain-containing protein [Granulosicoccus sp.]
MQHLINRLQWRHLRLVKAIHETGQLSSAAERMAVTQPSASRMLAEIETMVEQRLFVRNPRGMTPTPIGHVFIQHTLSLLQGLTEAAKEVSSFASGTTGSASVGSVTGAAVAYVVPSVQRLLREASGADISIAVAHSEELIQGLLNGEYDFVLSRVPPSHDRRQFDFMQGRSEDIEFLVRAGHPLLEQKAITMDSFRQFGWVIQGGGTPIRESVEYAFVKNSIPLPDEIIVTTSLLVTIAYLQDSDAISPVTSEVAELIKRSATGGMSAVSSPDPITVEPYHLIQKKEHMLNPLALRLRDLVMDALQIEKQPTLQ